MPVNLLRLAAVLLVLSAAATAACSEDPALSEAGAEAIAEMAGPNGEPMGTVALTQGPRTLLLSVDVQGLSDGGHGFHIHETGACSPDFSAAGDHFNPDNRGHGPLHEDGAHAGDLPNIYAIGGAARADILTSAVTLDAGPANSLFDDDGSAIIIHAKPDTYGAEAGAGDRVACGVITRR